MTALLDTRRYMAVQPTLTELEVLDADLCDITVSVAGRRRYCHTQAASAAVDADGQIRILCAQHTAMYFPSR